MHDQSPACSDSTVTIVAIIDDWCYRLPGDLSFKIEMQLWRFVTYDTIWTYIVAETECDASTFGTNPPFEIKANYNPRFETNPLFQACFKNAYGNGFGFPLHACASGTVQDGLLCYPSCKTNYYGVGPVCWETCKSDSYRHRCTMQSNRYLLAKAVVAHYGADCGCREGYTDFGMYLYSSRHIVAKGTHMVEVSVIQWYVLVTSIKVLLCAILVVVVGTMELVQFVGRLIKSFT